MYVAGPDGGGHPPQWFLDVVSLKCDTVQIGVELFAEAEHPGFLSEAKERGSRSQPLRVQKQKANPSGMAHGSGYLSQLVQLDVAHFMIYATGFLAELHGVFLVFPDLQE